MFATHRFKHSQAADITLLIFSLLMKIMLFRVTQWTQLSYNRRGRPKNTLNIGEQVFLSLNKITGRAGVQCLPTAWPSIPDPSTGMWPQLRRSTVAQELSMGCSGKCPHRDSHSKLPTGSLFNPYLS